MKIHASYFVCLLPAFCIPAATLHVSKSTGSLAGTGSSSNPFVNIQQAAISRFLCAT
jgi:hypothetical protein